MSETLSLEPVDPSAQKVIALFEEGPFQAVKFPDVDRAILVELAEQVRHASEEVEKTRASLAAALASLAEKRGALTTRCHRALGYARIYASDDVELLRALEDVEAPRSRAPVDGADALAAPGGRKRGRPRKVVEGEALFAVPPSEAVAAE